MKPVVDTFNMAPNNRLSSTVRFVKYLLLHSTFCYIFSVLIGWIQMNIYVYGIFGNKQPFASEFAGLYVMLAVFPIGPLNCLLVSPLHLFIYIKKIDKSKHWYSIAVSVCIVLTVLLVLYGLTIS